MTAPGTPLFDPLFTTAAMRAVFCDRARVQAMLDFEAALARAQARLGMIPAAAVPAIVAQCRVERFDLDALGREAALAGNALIPLVKALTAHVASGDASAAGHVHQGATSQDATDTGLVLQLRAGFDLIATELDRLATALARLADAHRDTPMAGRTWLQQGQPIVFGLKAARWLEALERQRARLAECRARALVVQAGGAVGTLAAWGPRALALPEALAEELSLVAPALPWHAERDRIAETGTMLGLLIGTLGKIARDVSLLMQSEVAEAFEPAAPGKGGSSAMPQKRNPVGAAVVLAASTRAPGLVATLLAAMPQEHERGLGGWHAEWETLPELFLLAAGALAHTGQMMEGLEVDAARMRANLEASHGLVYAGTVSAALAARLGARAAHELVEAAAKRALAEGRHLREVLAADARVRAELDAQALAALFDPRSSMGPASALIDRVLQKP